MTQESLWQLRLEIRLCSLFYADYRNSFGIGCHPACDSFDGYADYLEELMQAGVPDYNDVHFFDLLKRFDTSDNLWDWYCCFEDDPLPIPALDEDEAG